MESRVLVHNLLWVSLWSYLGVATRVALSSLRQPFLVALGPGYFLPNILGCLVMGLAAGLHSPGGRAHHLLIGLMTGFCGSCTTFATWNAGVAKELVRGAVCEGGLHLLLSFATSFLSLRLGKHLAKALKVAFPPKTRAMDQDEGEMGEVCKLHTIPLAMVTVSVTVVVWVLGFTLPEECQPYAVPVIFAPLGAGLRYLFSLQNASYPRFPLFTFIPNVSGSVINIFIAIILHSYIVDGNPRAELHRLWLGKGLSTGGMGSLSTVSSWVNELDKLGDGETLLWAHIYGWATVAVTQFLCVSIAAIWVATGHDI